MKQDILFEYARKAGLPTGDVLAYYDLSGIISAGDVLLDSDGNNKARDHQYKAISGHTTSVYDTYILFNQLYSTGSQLINTGESPSEDTEYVIGLENHPAQILSNSTSITGSGHFDGQSLLSVVKPMTQENWTCFLDFSGEFSSKRSDLNQVLISTMTGYDCLSGFNVGINGSNRLYYEYVAGTSTEASKTYLDRTVETIPNSLKDFNLLSISKTPSSLELSLHRPDREPFSLITPLEDGYQDSSSLLFGGFNTHDEEHLYDPNLFYTGYSGFVNSIVLFDDYMNLASREVFAESFYLESYVPPALTTQSRTVKEVTGVEVQKQSVGFGPAGYKRMVSGYLKDQNGNLIPNYYNAETGQAIIYKDVLVDLVGSNDVTSVTGFFTPEVPVRSKSYISKANATKGSINLTVPLDDAENLEIYTHNSHLNTINYNSDKTYSFGGFDLADGTNFRVEGYQLENENFSYDANSKQPFIQLYRNGFIQYEVSGLFSVNDIFNDIGDNLKDVGDLNGAYKGNYFINNNNAGVEPDLSSSLLKYPLAERIDNNRYEVALNSQSDILDEDDFIYFDVVSGPSITGVYEGVDKHFTDEYIDKDVYLNGMKLISGTDYIQSSHGGKVSYLMQASALGTDQADLLFTPQASTSFTQTKYSSTAGSNFSIPSVFDEQVWRNGLRQAPGIDYTKKPENSLIGLNTPSSENQSFIFDPDSTDLDIKIEDREAPMPRYRSKIFSFDSQQKTNLFSGAT